MSKRAESGEEMKKSEIIQIINDAIKIQSLCRVGYKYNDYLKYMFPLKANEKLFLSSIEADFEFGGYHIGKLTNIDEIDVKASGDILFEIIKQEGLSNYMVVPDVDLLDWKAVFISLQKLGKYIIVKNENDDDSNYAFVIGKIMKVTTKSVTMKNFNADGIWEDDLYQIPFKQITSVEFNTRYCNVFSKYI